MGIDDRFAGAGGDDGRAEDELLWAVFQGLVDTHGRTKAARVLGVNYRTVVANLEAGRVSRRMRNALLESQESKAEQPEETEGRGAGLVEAREDPKSVRGPKIEERVTGEWRPGASGLPDGLVVTLEHQPGEENALGSAAELVAEWRGLRTGGTRQGSGVDQARSEERRWELELLLTEEYGFTLPPGRELLQGPRRAERLRWLREALEHARRQRVTAERWARLRLVLTLGLWRSG